MYKKKKTGNKPILVMISVFLMAALLLGGSLAWTDFTQSKTNKFRGTTDPDVTLHDEFDGENKDIFVENSGTQTIYVRVRLDEYMEIGGESFVPTAKVRDKSTWTPHNYPQDGSPCNDCGNVDDGNPIHLFHRYHTWEMSGAQRNYKPGTPGLVYSKLGADDKVDTTGPNKTAPANAPVIMTTYTNILSKSSDSWTGAEKDLVAEVQKGCWLLDSDGWAYWSIQLNEGEATNLLLDKVITANNTPEDDWFYGIDVKLQAVTLNDFSKWNDKTNSYSTTKEADILVNHWQTAV